MKKSMNDPAASFKKLVDVVDTLMAEGGCPWDLVQTRETLKPFLVEEVYETLEALDRGNPEEIKDELGDLLYQILFHAKISAKKNQFDIGDVVQSISEKMVRRHPHVFKKETLGTPEEVITQWEEIKKTEKSNAHRKSVLDGVPIHSPGLMRAQKLQKKAAKHGFDWDKIEEVFEKLDEEIAEFKQAILTGKNEEAEGELGDILFVLVNIARFKKLDAEEALRATNNKFIQRFQHIEQEVEKKGQTLKDTPLAELEAHWQDAKRLSS
jgi:tetrapyrrole methylase family protein/MazG family protein